uniref:Serine peptidase inhibitor, Kunitz type 3 n=1 Tax=Myotis myotis TaxID=51298 RepID=A0A7J7W131_MYOMY|nr:serine peptidase inhibitor, Kunitz type 3 [Myotis myotis]
MQLRIALPFLLFLTFSQEFQSEAGTGQSTHHQNHQPSVSPEDCKLPMEKGPCRAKLPRWFYNSSTYGCMLFHFGGCNGNGNNFLKKDACEKTCKNI